MDIIIEQVLGLWSRWEHPVSISLDGDCPTTRSTYLEALKPTTNLLVGAESQHL